MKRVQITYEGITDKKAFGNSVVQHLAGVLGFWPCSRLLWSTYFGKTPGTARVTIKMSDNQAREVFEEIGRMKAAIR